MKLKFSLFCAAVVCLTTTGKARIGESEAELTRRYGPVASEKDSFGTGEVIARLYHFHGFDVLVNMSGGHSQSELYRKTDRSIIRLAEVREIVLVNCGAPLGKTTQLDDKLCFTIGDIIGIYSVTSPQSLYLTTAKFGDRLSVLEKEGF